MSAPIAQTFDDSLLLVNYSKAIALVEGFFNLLKQKMTGPTLTFHMKEEDEQQVFFFESVNKYFSAKVQILFGDESTFAMENTESAIEFENCAFVIDTMDDWARFNSNLKVLRLLRKSQKFKTLIVNEKILGKINTNQFYEIIESYISVFGFTSDSSSTDTDENENTIDEIIDMLANNVWNHSVSAKAKPKHPADPDPSQEGPIQDEAPAKFKEKADEGFLSAFEQIMNFKSESANLSPKSRKLKACEIMMGLVNTFENEDFEDFDIPPTDDFDGYEKFS